MSELDSRYVYLIDSSIYIFRSWHVLPETIQTPDGEPANALYGFADFLAKLLTETKARYIVCAFDQSLQTSKRNELYPDYKANRESAPESLKQQFVWCRELCTKFGITNYTREGYEADDIIGTLANRAKDQGMPACIVSADKDLSQFIGEQDIYWNYTRGDKLDHKKIEKRFGVRPDQIADLLALCGDKVDNIPGIPGVGATTAAKLLVKYDNLDSLLENKGKVPDMKFRGAQRVAELLALHEDTVKMARQLTGLWSVPGLPRKIAPLQRKRTTVSQTDKWLADLGFSDRRRDRLLDALEQSMW